MQCANINAGSTYNDMSRLATDINKGSLVPRLHPPGDEAKQHACDKQTRTRTKNSNNVCNTFDAILRV